MSKSKNTAKKLSSKESKTECLTTPLSSAISEHSLIQDVQNFTEELRTSYQAAFPAKTLAVQAQAEGLGVKGRVCGKKCFVPFASYSPDTFLWKTRQRYLFEDSVKSQEIWPQWGTIANGECYPEKVLVPQLKENEFLLPSPTASMGKRGWGISITGRKRYSEKLIKNAMSYGYKPHPQILEWAMGWPITWAALRQLETVKFHKWLQQHGIS